MKHRLTEAEIKVLKLIKDGLENREIAPLLNVSVATVKYYLTNITLKLKAKNRTQAVYFAYTKGIIK